MANGEKVEKEKLPEPTFIEQANLFIEKKFEDAKLIEDPKFGPGLSIFDHKVLVGLMELQVNHVNDILVEKYTSQISETYTQLTRVLHDIQKDQKTNFNKINKRLLRAEKLAKAAFDKVGIEETKIEEHRILIEALRTDYEVNKLELEKIAKHKPTLETIQKVFTFWTWKKNWFKISGVILVVLAMFVLLLVGVVYYMHKRGWVTENMTHKTGMQQIEADIKTGHISPITRGARSIHYTDAQRDSVITSNQNGILMQIEKRNKEYNKLSEAWRSKK